MRMPDFENDRSRTELDMSRFNQLFANANKQQSKADAGKPQLTLVPRKILFDIARVREYGTKKYGDPENWRQVEIQRYRDAAFRHFLAYLDDPEGVDEERGCLTSQDERKLMILYEMYGDCMYTFRELMRKAQNVRR